MTSRKTTSVSIDLLFDIWIKNFIVKSIYDYSETYSVEGIIDTSEHYGPTCKKLAFALDYKSKTLEVGFVEEGNEENNDEMGDLLIEINFSDKDWVSNVVKHLGTFEDIKKKYSHLVDQSN